MSPAYRHLRLAIAAPHLQAWRVLRVVGLIALGAGTLGAAPAAAAPPAVGSGKVEPPPGPPGPSEVEPPPSPLLPGEVEPPPGPLLPGEVEPPPSPLLPGEVEPPPGPLAQSPPRQPPIATGQAPSSSALRPPKSPRPLPPRVAFELGLAGSALLNQGVYGFGGVVDLGARFRLRFGAVGVSLRIGLEQHVQPEPAPFLMNLGGSVTYLLARPGWRVSPYIGLWMQGMLQRTPDALGAVALQRSEGGLTLGGLGGAQLRLGRGGIFTEVGYRHTVYRQTLAAIPAWNAALLLLGYRISTN